MSWKCSADTGQSAELGTNERVGHQTHPELTPPELTPLICSKRSNRKTDKPHMQTVYEKKINPSETYKGNLIH